MESTWGEVVAYIILLAVSYRGIFKYIKKIHEYDYRSEYTKRR